MMTRTYNFGAGPAMLPESVLKEAQEELLNWQDTGMSILEIGHRTPEFMSLLNHAEQTLRYLLAIPQDYQVLFLGGAARTQFATIPMNLLNSVEQAGYLVTGIWSHMAFLEAKRLKKAYCVASDEKNGFTGIPDPATWVLNDNTSYLYYTPNETINGIRFPFIPCLTSSAHGLAVKEEGLATSMDLVVKTNRDKRIPLIADMTSCLLSEPIDIRDYGLIFAGAQKNIANAGLTIVIVRNDLLAKIPDPAVPTMLDYKIQAEHHSLYATPPVFNCYLAAKMFDWVKAQGGINTLFQLNCEKAAKLYQYLDASDFYFTKISKEARSLMNICFSLKSPSLEELFVKEAQLRGLSALKGHRMVGGIRASLYNAMPIAGVDALIDFMSEFARKNSK